MLVWPEWRCCLHFYNAFNFNSDMSNDNVSWWLVAVSWCDRYMCCTSVWTLNSVIWRLCLKRVRSNPDQSNDFVQICHNSLWMQKWQVFSYDEKFMWILSVIIFIFIFLLNIWLVSQTTRRTLQRSRRKEKKKGYIIYFLSLCFYGIILCIIIYMTLNVREHIELYCFLAHHKYATIIRMFIIANFTLYANAKEWMVRQVVRWIPLTWQLWLT